MVKNSLKKITVMHIISSLKIGGAEAVLVDLVRALGNDHYEHHVVYFHSGPNVARLQAIGVVTHHVRGFVCRYDPVFFVRLCKIVHKINPRVLHGSLWAANLFTRILGWLYTIPTICGIHSGVEIDGFLRNSIDRFTLRFTNQIVAVYSAVAQSLHARSAWGTAAKVLVIKNGIDQKQVVALRDNNAQRRSDYGFDERHIVIGTVGRFVEVKNFPMLIRAFKELYDQDKNCRLLFVGQGPQEAELRVLVKALDMQDVVTFVIGQPAYGYYALMDLFVLPSFQEGLSIALLEALSCGLPSIVTHDGITHDVLQNYHNGIVIPVGDEKELLLAMKRLLQDRSLRAQLGLSARKTVEENFSVHIMAQKYAQLYETLL